MSRPLTPKRLVLMRGLPSCGKSHRARRLAAEADGVALEFDAFFETPQGFKWQRSRLGEARKAHLAAVRQALDAGQSPIIVDDDHRPGPTAKAVAAAGLFAGYSIEFAEPDSPWWRTIAPLLTAPAAHRDELARWAQKLRSLSRTSHRVPPQTLLRRMQNWTPDLTIVDLLAWNAEVAA